MDSRKLWIFAALLATLPLAPAQRKSAGRVAPIGFAPVKPARWIQLQTRGIEGSSAVLCSWSICLASRQY